MIPAYQFIAINYRNAIAPLALIYLSYFGLIQGISNLCVRNVKSGREDLNKQISYSNVGAECRAGLVEGAIKLDG